MGDSLPRSPLAPAAFPQLPVIKGLRLCAGAAGVKYQGRDDVMLAVMDPGTTVAGTFTRSKTRSAPVRDCQAKLGGDSSAGAAILVNSGNSNAFTGHYGQTSVAEICAAVADITGLPEARIFTASTGVIGEPLPHGRPPRGSRAGSPIVPHISCGPALPRASAGQKYQPEDKDNALRAFDPRICPLLT